MLATGDIMNFITKLDSILLSTNAVEKFNEEYSNNIEFKNWLLSILPQVEDCKNQKQNNPWHKYNVLDHILHAVEEMNKQTTNLNTQEQRLLSYTMFYHDIAKPACHLTRFSKLYNQRVDSFFNHNIKSAEIASSTLKHFNFSEEEVKIIEKLVLEHDMFMNISEFPTQNKYKKVLSIELIEEEIQNLSEVGDGLKLMKFLVLVGRSDNLAQNEKMTSQSLSLLDKIEQMLANIKTETTINKF